MIKIKLRLAAEDIKWKKRTGERKQSFIRMWHLSKIRRL